MLRVLAIEFTLVSMVCIFVLKTDEDPLVCHYRA